ncbi:MAG TPA: iron-containing alcohol dehydrogenase [Clostridiaceae bacterium]|nr:iron-containing alcohol dehydrogenase [Clostridiaceae bacterium]
MRNFSFRNATRIIFGKGTENNVGEEILPYSSKVLLVYGGGSIKLSGLYDRVVESLRKSGIDFMELPGVKPNPRLELAIEGVRICKEHGIGFILSVGGGSAGDTAKAISAGACYDGELWDLFEGKAKITEVLPVGIILTLPATGTESSTSTILTKEEGLLKIGMSSELLRPAFAILNPELTFTLPPYQTAAGACDIMGHLIERYFTNEPDVDFTDRLIEATLKTIIHHAPIVLREPSNYASRAEIMWAGTFAHNGLLSTGRVGDWASHAIEHELSALYDIAHGAGLSIIYPAWMTHVYRHNVNRFMQFAVKVWDVDMSFDSPEAIALEGIARMKEFFRKLGLPVSFQDADLPEYDIEEMADKCTKSGTMEIGNLVKLDKSDVIEIYKMAK